MDTPSLSMNDQPCASGAWTDIHEGSLNGSKVCVEKIRVYLNGDPQKVRKVCHLCWHFSRPSFKQTLQILCKRVAIRKHLAHPNVVQFLGATLHPPQLVSVWVPSRGLTEYVRAHPEENRLKLVGSLPVVTGEDLILFSRYVMSLRAWTISTNARLFTVI